MELENLDLPATTPENWKRSRHYQTLEKYFAKAQIDSFDIFHSMLNVYGMDDI